MTEGHEIGAYFCDLHTEGTIGHEILSDLRVDSPPDEFPAAAIQTKMEANRPFDRSELPRQLVRMGPPRKRERFALFNSFICVRDQAADVIAAHDLGEGFMWPMELVTRQDRNTPLQGRWFGVHVGARKQAYRPEKSILSEKLRDHPTIYSIKPLLPPVELGAPGAVCVGPAALEGADIWRDPLLGSRGLFVSPRLHDALTAAKVARDFHLSACTLVRGERYPQGG